MKNLAQPWFSVLVGAFVPPPVDPWDLIPSINLSSSGDTFSPQVHLYDGVEAAVRWVFSDGSTSSDLAPVKDFGTAGSRAHTLKVDPPTAIECLNFGFNDQEDGGIYSTPATYNKYPTSLSALSGLQEGAPSLQRLLVSHTYVVDLDLSGLTSLEVIEAFNTRTLETANMEGCTALRRVCFEGDNLRTIDVSSATAIEDVRFRGQGITQNYQGDITVVLGDTSSTWHICFGTQGGTVHGLDGIMNGTVSLPAIIELWPWDAHIGGAFSPNMPGGTFRAFWGSGCDFTSANCANMTWGEAAPRELYLNGNPLTSINLTGCDTVQSVDFQNCGLTEALVDYVLGYFAGVGMNNGTINLGGTNAAPSSTGLGHLATLQAAGCTVTVAP